MKCSLFEDNLQNGLKCYQALPMIYKNGQIPNTFLDAFSTCSHIIAGAEMRTAHP